MFKVYLLFILPEEKKYRYFELVLFCKLAVFSHFKIFKKETAFLKIRNVFLWQIALDENILMPKPSPCLL